MGSANDNRMGIAMTSALVIGIMIGSGIFMLPVSLAPLGANAVIGWLASGIGAVCIAFALGRLSRLGGDGIQANIEARLGRIPAFMVAWAFWVSNWAAQSAVAIAAASALSWVYPAWSGPHFVIPVAIGSVVVLTAVNAQGARTSGWMSVITVVIKLLPLFAVIAILALRGVHRGHYEPLAAAPLTLANLATAVALTFFALTGFENATAPVGKVRDPERTIPRAVVGGTVFVALVYLLASTGVQLLLPTATVATSPAPYADVIAAQFGGRFASLSALAIAIAAFGSLNGMILGTGELGYAMGLRGDLPAFMTWTRHGNTPVGAQMFGSALTIALILCNVSRSSVTLFTFIILLSTAAILVVYFAGAIAAWRLTASLAERAVIVVALLFVVFATYGSGMEADLWCCVLLAMGLGVYAVMHRTAIPGLARRAVSDAV